MSRHHAFFVKDNSDEEKVANIIVGLSQLDEVLALFLTNYFLKINDTDKNKRDRDNFEKLILRELSFRKKVDIVCKLIDNSGAKDFKNKLYKVGEIRNYVAHSTGLLGMPKNIKGTYEDFNVLMEELEGFMDFVYHEYDSDMTYAYDRKN